MIAMRIAVLDSFTTDQGLPVWASLERLGDVTVHARTASSALHQRLAGVTALLTNKVAIRAADVQQLPDLRYIGVTASGYNIIDIEACRTRGIAVTNVPGYSTESVAQLVFALILHHTHDVAGHATRALGDGWAMSPDFCFFTKPLHELAGKTLLVIGSGAIGNAVARIGTAFGMRVVAGQVPGSTSTNRVPLAEAVPHADVISLHCPLTPATTTLVDAAFLARCKSTVMLINTGRGPLIDELALAEALATERIGFAGLDVLSHEPPPTGHPLLRPDAPWRSRLIVTPHIGWGTVEARQRLVSETIANLEAWKQAQSRNRIV